MRELQIAAPAKINLGLSITGRRDDGYHDVRLVMQTIGLFDLVTVREESEGIRLSIDVPALADPAQNIACRAAALFFETTGIRRGISINIEKHIPVAAGLAGGSTDAAAVLNGCRALFAPDLPVEELLAMGKELGADVPYCVLGGTMLAEGIGEKLTALPPLPAWPLVLVKPEAGASTGEIYRRFDARTDIKKADIDGLLQAVQEADIHRVASRMGNEMEAVTEELVPEVAELIRFLEGQGALVARMSGSGPSVFGLFETDGEAEAAYAALKKAFPACAVFLTVLYQPNCIFI